MVLYRNNDLKAMHKKNQLDSLFIALIKAKKNKNNAKKNSLKLKTRIQTDWIAKIELYVL